MSKHETWRTRMYWREIGGLLIEEFVAVRRTKTTGFRAIDGVIILGEETRISENNFEDLEGKDVIVVQTKKSRLGMYLLGQALFSRKLIERFNPRSVKSVAICGKTDELLEDYAKEYGIEVRVIGESDKLERI